MEEIAAEVWKVEKTHVLILVSFIIYILYIHTRYLIRIIV